LAHIEIISNLVEIAKQNNYVSVIYTFEQHPRNLLSSDKIDLLTTIEEKIKIFTKLGVNYVILQKFNPEFSTLSAIDFIKKYLIDKLNLKFLIVGDDHKIGHDRMGDFETLVNLGKVFNFEVLKVKSVIIEKQRISSTLVRKLLKQGNIETANKMLGYNYFLHGKVVVGSKIGSKIGFPTANIEIDDNKLIPSNGVYAVNFQIDNNFHLAMCNIGHRPSINFSEKTKIEVHIFNFSENIYDKNIRLLFIKRIRDEYFFNSTDELIEQISKDKKQILDEFFEKKLQTH
jgi:riboflavin kinase/FMN adenylyltransferase